MRPNADVRGPELIASAVTRRCEERDFKPHTDHKSDAGPHGRSNAGQTRAAKHRPGADFDAVSNRK